MVIRHITLSAQAPLKKQLLGFFLASVFVLSMTTSLVTAWLTSKKLEDETLKTATQISLNFAEQATLALLTGSQVNGQEAVERVLGFESVSQVAILDMDLKILSSSSKLNGSALQLQLNALPQTPQLIDEKPDYWRLVAPVLFAEDLPDFAMDVAEPMQTRQQLEGYVLIDYDKTAIRQVQQAIFLNNVGIGALVTLLLASVMYFLLDRLTSPLSELSATMAQARDSGHYLMANPGGAKEIRQMADVYNQMMSRLAVQREALEKNRATLESEVEIRTQELKVARDSALTASRHKSEFLANMSHELRTPLQAIIGYTDLVREELELEGMSQQVSDLDKAIRSASHLLVLIGSILDLAKIEAGRMDLNLQSVNMNHLLNETLDTVRPIAVANANQLQLVKGELSTYLLIDRQKLMQIFLNLLSNACKFTRHGLVTFAINNDDERLYFSVTDTGQGIPSDKLDYIFEQFTQVDASQSRRFEGTGLGMAITQSFCQMMGAKIKVESQLGQGSCFSVVVPLRRGN